MVKEIYIHGFGIEGQAAFSHFKGQKVIVINQKVEDGMISEDAALDLFKIKENWTDCLYIRSAGIPPTNKVIKWLDEQGYQHQTALSYWLGNLAPKKTITVTGSKGKSSTSAIIAHLLQGKLIGNIGISPFDITWCDDDIAVIEASSYQLYDLQHPSAYHMVTNIYKEHTDWHGGIEAYKHAKHRPFILGAKGLNEQELKKHADALPPLDPSISRAEPFFTNLKNALALIKQTNYCDFDLLLSTLSSRLETFSPLSHRQEIIADINGIIWMDDALATIPEATLLAIQNVQDTYNHIHLLIGGKDRGQDYTQFLKDIKNTTNLHLYAFSEVKEKLVSQHTRLFSSFKDAIIQAKSSAKSGDIILFSPAAASEVPFSSYLDRSALFKQFAHEQNQ